MEISIVTKEEIYTKVIARVKAELNIKVDILQSDDLIDFGLDSLTTVRLLVSLEELFNMTFEDDDLMLDNFHTINKISEMIAIRIA